MFYFNLNPNTVQFFGEMYRIFYINQSIQSRPITGVRWALLESITFASTS